MVDQVIFLVCLFRYTPIGRAFPEDSFGALMIETAKRYGLRKIEIEWGLYAVWDLAPVPVKE